MTNTRITDPEILEQRYNGIMNYCVDVVASELVRCKMMLEVSDAITYVTQVLF